MDGSLYGSSGNPGHSPPLVSLDHEKLDRQTLSEGLKIAYVSTDDYNDWTPVPYNISLSSS